MHTMVVRMSIDPERADEAARHLREDVVAWARQQPGFVNGQWLRSPDGSEGIAAASAARGPRSNPRDGSRAWNVEDVTVYEQLTSA
jgi:quinol monooxygenase YgiN